MNGKEVQLMFGKGHYYRTYHSIKRIIGNSNYSDILVFLINQYEYYSDNVKENDDFHKGRKYISQATGLYKTAIRTGLQKLQDADLLVYEIIPDLHLGAKTYISINFELLATLINEDTESYKEYFPDVKMYLIKCPNIFEIRKKLGTLTEKQIEGVDTLIEKKSIKSTEVLSQEHRRSWAKNTGGLEPRTPEVLSQEHINNTTIKNNTTEENKTTNVTKVTYASSELRSSEATSSTLGSKYSKENILSTVNKDNREYNGAPPPNSSLNALFNCEKKEIISKPKGKPVDKAIAWAESEIHKNPIEMKIYLAWLNNIGTSHRTGSTPLKTALKNIRNLMKGTYFTEEMIEDISNYYHEELERELNKEALKVPFSADEIMDAIKNFSTAFLPDREPKRNKEWLKRNITFAKFFYNPDYFEKSAFLKYYDQEAPYVTIEKSNKELNFQTYKEQYGIDYCYKPEWFDEAMGFGDFTAVNDDLLPENEGDLVYAIQNYESIFERHSNVLVDKGLKLGYSDAVLFATKVNEWLGGNNKDGNCNMKIEDYLEQVIEEWVKMAENKKETPVIFRNHLWSEWVLGKVLGPKQEPWED